MGCKYKHTCNYFTCKLSWALTMWDVNVNVGLYGYYRNSGWALTMWDVNAIAWAYLGGFKCVEH
mgnify:CR=1 FL=1